MAQVWTTPRDWTNGETVTDTLLNAQVRDNLTYLKGVLDGASLQPVTIADAQAFKQGAYFVHRRPSAKGHIASGNTTIASLTGSGSTTVSVSFTAFSSAPNLVAGCNGATSRDPRDVHVQASAVSTTGATLTVYLSGAGDATNIKCTFIADGPD